MENASLVGNRIKHPRKVPLVRVWYIGAASEHEDQPGPKREAVEQPRQWPESHLLPGRFTCHLNYSIVGP